LSKFLVFSLSKKQQKLSEENQWLRTSCNLWILCKHCTWLDLLVDIGIIKTHLSSKLILLMTFYFVNTSLSPLWDQPQHTCPCRVWHHVLI
jgi:hypothetical protein